MCRQICTDEIQRQLVEFEAGLHVRVAQHAELKLREMLPQLGVTKGEYTSDRSFTENALEHLRLDLEDLRLSERARDESTGGGQHPPSDASRRTPDVFDALFMSSDPVARSSQSVGQSSVFHFPQGLPGGDASSSHPG